MFWNALSLGALFSVLGIELSSLYKIDRFLSNGLASSSKLILSTDGDVCNVFSKLAAKSLYVKAFLLVVEAIDNLGLPVDFMF